MMKRIVCMMLSTVLTATTIVSSTVSCNSTICSSITSNNITSDSIVDNKQVQDIDEMVINRDSIQLYHAKTKEEYDRLTPIIENRNGKIIIEVIDGTVLDDEGNGSDQFGFYVKYDSERFHKGNRVQSVFIYNPDTNYVDDIICRIDTQIE